MELPIQPLAERNGRCKKSRLSSHLPVEQLVLRLEGPAEGRASCVMYASGRSFRQVADARWRFKSDHYLCLAFPQAASNGAGQR